MKTLEQWESGEPINFDEFVEVGDAVDEAMVMYFAEVVPGGMFGTHNAQCGEASRSTADGLLYATFHCEKGTWHYVGDQLRLPERSRGWTGLRQLGYDGNLPRPQRRGSDEPHIPLPVWAVEVIEDAS